MPDRLGGDIRWFLAGRNLLAALLVSLILPAAANAGQVVIDGDGDCDNLYEYFTVPADVTWLQVEAYGGYGGGNEPTGAGGAGGQVSTVIPVQQGQQLAISAGSYGGAHGACGWAAGGDRGYADGGDDYGRDGYGGGSASAVLDYDSSNNSVSPLVVAGGGGGGGGNGHHAGGYGGTGGSGPNGTAQGGHNGHGEGSGDGGSGGGEAGTHGGSGDSVDAGLGGAGGGGGGGYPYAGSGGGSGSEGGGGGGGGGRSWVIGTGQQTQYSTAGNSCPWPDSPSSCNGQVTLTWDLTPAQVNVVSGSGQQAQLGQPFPQRLVAQVNNAEGFPIEDVTVNFNLPAGGPSGTFASGGTTAEAQTNIDGQATSPVLVANGLTGSWLANATVGEAKANFNLTNQAASTTVVLSSSQQPSVAGQPVQFTANLQTETRLPTPWTGTVQFQINGDPLGGPQTVTPAGVAISPSVDLGVGPYPVGNYTITAAYSGDVNHTQATSFPFTQTVNPAATATTLVSNPNPSTSGQSPILTATVTSQQGSTATPTGQVQFKVATSPGGEPADWGAPVDLDANGSADSNPFPFPVDGDYEIAVEYLGNASFTASQGSGVQQVGIDATSTNVSSSVNPSVAGQPYTITATVLRTGPGDEPEGEVDFTIGTRDLCLDVELDAQGQATCPGPVGLPAQPNVIRADFSDPANQYAPSYGLMTQSVTAASSRTTLTVGADQTYGKSFTATATVETVAPGQVVPRGTVQFYVDDTPVGLPVPVVQGAATSIPLSGLTAGAHRIAADYEDDSDPTRLQSSRGVAPIQVDPAPTTVTVISSANPAEHGQAIRFVARVTSDQPVTGDVQFLVDGAAFGGPVPITSGVAISQQTSTLKPGTHTVEAESHGGVPFLPGRGSLAQSISTVDPPEPPIPPGEQPRAWVRGMQAAVSPDGQVNLPIACSGPTAEACAGTIVMRTDSGRMLGTKAFHLGTGRLRAFRLQITGNLRALRFRHRFATEVTLSGPNLPATKPKRMLISTRGAALAIVKTRTARLNAKGRLALKVRCRSRTERCQGVLTVNRGDGRRVGRTTYRIRGQNTRFVTIRVNRSVRRALRGGRTLTMRARTLTRIPFGRQRVAVKRFSLKGASR